MPKPKRKGKAKADTDSGPDVDPLASLAAANESDEEISGAMQTLALAQKQKKKLKKKNTKNADSDSEQEVMGTDGFSFAMLDVDEDGKASESSEQEEASVKQAPARTEGKGKSKKKKAQKAAGEEELDALLAAIEQPSTKEEGKKKKKKRKGVDVEPEVAEEFADAIGLKEAETAQTLSDIERALEQEEEEMKKKQRKKKKPKEEVEQKEEEGGEEEGHTVKTKAEKRKEKKEKEKQKKKQHKAGEVEKKEQSAAAGTTDVGQAGSATGVEAESTLAEAEGSVQAAAAGSDEEERNKSKKKKKKKEKEEKEKSKSKPGKAALAAMKDKIAQIREEEERQRREQEERIRREEEAEAERLRKKQEDEEKRQRRQQKEKERRLRLKAEGKLLTAKQKADKAKAQQMLDAMGIVRPDASQAPKRPTYSKMKRRQYKPQAKADTVQPEVESPREEEPEVAVTEVKGLEENDTVAAEVIDSWDADSYDAEVEIPDVISEAVVTSVGKEAASIEESSSEEESSEEEDVSEEETSSEEDSEDEATQRERALARIKQRKEENEKHRCTDVLRAAVVCVLGHVDTGKTKILDKLRRTHVQDNEAGGITQQIGATNVPLSAIREQTKYLSNFQEFELKLPGLLIIDTPGHESFSNLRTRGSSLCDIAILVVDIMHGLEPQTIESINLLKKKKCPFVVALNKIDRLFEFQSNPRQSVQETLAQQAPNTQLEFRERVAVVFGQMAEQGLNVALFYENPNEREYVSMIPTSAHSGDGMADLMAYLCTLSQTRLAARLAFSEELQAIVMEVKALPGLGTTVDVILVNGRLRVGETIVLAGTEGPIVTQIRDILTPQPMKELRVKAQYQRYKELRAAQGVKLIAKELDNTLAGLPLLVATHSDEVPVLKEEIAETISEALRSFKLEERGVYVQASTLGSLEALLEFLRSSKIPYAGLNIGPVHRKDVMKSSVMLEHDSSMAVILAFDVKVERDAQEMADTMNVKIFSADIIYHLFDKFTAYVDEIKEKNKENFKHVAVFPCKLRILPNCVFNSRDPIVVGVAVEAGIVRPGTPLCVPAKEGVMIGRIASIEFNHKVIESAKKGNEVCIKIEPMGGEAPKMIGRHFEETDLIVSKISRESIDALKQYFRDEMTKPDWQLVIELKKTFQII